VKGSPERRARIALQVRLFPAYFAALLKGRLLHRGRR